MARPDRIECEYDDRREIAVFHCVDATKGEVEAEVAGAQAQWAEGNFTAPNGAIHRNWWSVHIDKEAEVHHMFDHGTSVLFRNADNRADHVEIRLDDVVLWVQDGYDKGCVMIRLKDEHD